MRRDLLREAAGGVTSDRRGVEIVQAEAKNRGGHCGAQVGQRAAVAEALRVVERLPNVPSMPA